MGASAGSETTAAATGQVGVVRRDPMAMLPFCGYNMASYWNHWLSFGAKSSNLPKIFNVNWFRQDAAGNFIWPGFGENLRVLRWVLDRCAGEGAAERTPIGYLPGSAGIDTAGLDLDQEAVNQLYSVDSAAWSAEMDAVDEFFGKFGDQMPASLKAQTARIKNGLRSA